MEQTYSVKQIIISLIIVMAVIIIFYGVTVLLTKNKQNDDNNNTFENNEVVIQYDEIIVGEIYNQTPSEYYVLAYTGDDSQTYISKVSTYGELDGAIKTYQIDLSSAFNKKYVASESNFYGTYPVFSETTLIKIVDKKITETYTGTDITTQIENMTNMIKE